MEKYFINAWDANKDKLEEYFKNNTMDNYCEYNMILQKILKLVVNGHDDKKFEHDQVKTIDFGEYHGTLILIFTEDDYQPSINQTYYTHVYYGSCSGCDTLEGIIQYNRSYLPNDEQVKDFMTLALNMIQNIKPFKE